MTPALATTRSKSPAIAVERVAVGDVGGDERASQLVRERLDALPAAGDEGHVGAGGGERPGGGGADPRGGAGDECGARFMAAMLRRAGAASQSSRDPRTPRARMPRARRARLFGMAELGDFLRTRRARLQPQDVGLPDHGRRRVPGLRREEIAQLAGVSVDYYVRLEQGRDIHPSEQVLEAIARALALSDDERAHLNALVHRRKRARRRRPERVRPERAAAARSPRRPRDGDRPPDGRARLQRARRRADGRLPRAQHGAPRVPRRRRRASSTRSGTRSPPRPSASCACPPGRSPTTRR